MNRRQPTLVSLVTFLLHTDHIMSCNRPDTRHSKYIAGINQARWFAPPRLGDAAPITGEATASASTPKYVGTSGRESRTPAPREITRVRLTPTTSWLALSSLVQGRAGIPSACGGTLAAPSRVVSCSLFLDRAPSLIYDMLTLTRDSSCLPWWE